MKHSTDRILTSHVGSLIRPPALQDFLRARQAGKPYDQQAYQTCLTQSVAEVVRHQVEVGVDVPSDGEFGKSISWSQYALERLAGFERRPIKSGGNPFTRGADRTKFAEFYAELDARDGVVTTIDAVCVGPIKYTGQAELKRDIDNFKAALKNVKVEEAFLPVAAPASVIPDRKNEFYKSDEELQVAIAEAMRDEYKQIIDAGFLVQLDDARNAVTYDRMVPPASFEDYRRWLAKQVDIINRAIAGFARRPHPLPRLLGFVAGSACQRRAAEGHRRSDPQDKSGRLRHRGRQSAPRARMERVEERQAWRRAGAHPRRHQPRHQRGRASRAGRRAHCSPGETGRPRERHRRHRLRFRAGAVPPPRPPDDPMGETRGARGRRPSCEQGTLGLRCGLTGQFTSRETVKERRMNVSAQQPSGLKIPFDHARLDRLMDQAGIDVVLATSKHNVQYLLGGHRANFFDYMDATGITRYLPVLVYPKGAPQKAAYIGHRLESFQHQAKPLWTPTTDTTSNGSVDAMQKAVDYMKKAGIKPKRIATEFGFLPYDASKVLRAAFPDADWVDGLYVLERQRLVKSADELKMLRYASDAVIDAMMATIAKSPPGSTKAEVVETLRKEETLRGMNFEYCLITAGTSFNRAPSDQKWEKGDIMSIDSGGNYHGYIGDVCRMAIQGEPDAELQDLLAEIEAIQQAAFKAMKPGAPGSAIYAAAEPLVQKSKHHNAIEFLAHGMGLVSHEAPRLTDHGPVPYPADDAGKPLEAGMVVSVETTLKHPSRGFIKLEDTAVVTPAGHDLYGAGARGWNKAG